MLVFKELRGYCSLLQLLTLDVLISSWNLSKTAFSWEGLVLVVEIAGSLEVGGYAGSSLPQAGFL